MARRSSPTLFELLSERRADAGDAPRAEPPARGEAGKPPPREAIDAPPPPPARLSPRPASPPRTESAGGEPIPPLRRLEVPLPVAVGAGVAMIVWSVVLWSVAFRVGESRAERDFRELLATRADAGIDDPLLEDDPGVGGELGVHAPGETPAGSGRSPGPDSSPGVGEGGGGLAADPGSPSPSGSGGSGRRYIVPGGFAPEDPRTPGFNYLQIASVVSRLGGQEATRLIAFLLDRGVPAVGVPVDRGGSGANNGQVYEIYVLDGVDGARFRRTAEERARLEERIHRLGLEWQREHGGSTGLEHDFQWTKYQP